MGNQKNYKLYLNLVQKNRLNNVWQYSILKKTRLEQVLIYNVKKKS